MSRSINILHDADQSTTIRTKLKKINRFLEGIEDIQFDLMLIRY